jgi:RNA polymerase sigma-70 factor (ECF subfamily)
LKNPQAHNTEKQQRFMQLYHPLHDRLSRFVQSMVWNTDDAKDVLSETILAAYENFEKVKNTDTFLYYLFTIASRLAKKRDRRKKFWGIFDSSAANLVASDHNSESQMAVNELYTALDKLPIKQRDAITLFEISGFSIKEIAEFQDSTLSGVKSRLMRARNQLTTLLEVEKKGRMIPERSTKQVTLHIKKTAL